jgi:hypothetical protein
MEVIGSPGRRSRVRRLAIAAVAVFVAAACGGSAGGTPTRDSTATPGAATTRPPGTASAATTPAVTSAVRPSSAAVSPTASAASTAGPGATASATTAATASPSPGASVTGPATASASSGSSPPAAAIAAWTRLASAGEQPDAREDHTWTVDGDGRIGYLFGGRAGDTTFDDLWAFDLPTGVWSRVRTAGGGPDARFGHTATWVPDVGLVIWSGQAGSTFFDDLWAFDPATVAWRRLEANGDVPAKRYGSCAALGPDGRLWISHGFTFSGRFSDTRAYDFGTSTWTDVTPEDAVPVERCLHDCWWTDGGKFLLYAGQTNGKPALGDLWSLTPAAGGGDATWEELPQPEPPARQLYAQAQLRGQSYVFGGSDADGRNLDDLWHVDPVLLVWSDLLPAEAPPARYGATMIADEVRDRMLLFGGAGDDGALDDAWELKLSVGG